MKPKTKKYLIISLIVFLFLINISALTTILIRRNQMVSIPERERQIHEPDRRMARGIRNEFNFNEYQFAEFKKINKKSFRMNYHLIQGIDSIRFIILEELSLENPDQEKLDSLVYEAGQFHMQLKRNTINHFLQLKEICTPEQEKVLLRMFNMMFEHTIKAPGPQHRKMDDERRRGSRGSRK